MEKTIVNEQEQTEDINSYIDELKQRIIIVRAEIKSLDQQIIKKQAKIDGLEEALRVAKQKLLKEFSFCEPIDDDAILVCKH